MVSAAGPKYDTNGYKVGRAGAMAKAANLLLTAPFHTGGGCDPCGDAVPMSTALCSNQQARTIKLLQQELMVASTKPSAGVDCPLLCLYKHQRAVLEQQVCAARPRRLGGCAPLRPQVAGTVLSADAGISEKACHAFTASASASMPVLCCLLLWHGALSHVSCCYCKYQLC